MKVFLLLCTIGVFSVLAGCSSHPAKDTVATGCDYTSAEVDALTSTLQASCSTTMPERLASRRKYLSMSSIKRYVSICLQEVKQIAKYFSNYGEISLSDANRVKESYAYRFIITAQCHWVPSKNGNIYEFEKECAVSPPLLQQARHCI